jgi:hypothetical protein
VSSVVLGYLLVGTLCLMYLTVASLAVWFVVRGAVRALRGRGEESGVPAVSRNDARDAVLVDGSQVDRRLRRLARDLAADDVLRRVEALFPEEVDR